MAKERRRQQAERKRKRRAMEDLTDRMSGLRISTRSLPSSTRISASSASSASGASSAAERLKKKRQSTSEAEKERERAKGAERMKRKRQSMSKEEKERERAKDAERLKKKRQSMSEEEKERERAKDAEQKRKKRQSMSEGENDDDRGSSSRIRSEATSKAGLPTERLAETAVPLQYMPDLLHNMAEAEGDGYEVAQTTNGYKRRRIGTTQQWYFVRLRGVRVRKERPRCSNCELLGHTIQNCSEPPMPAPGPLVATSEFNGWLALRKSTWSNQRGASKARANAKANASSTATSSSSVVRTTKCRCQSLMGRRVSKVFPDNVRYEGTIVLVDDFVQVRYDDNEVEDYTLDEVQRLLLPPNSSKESSDSASGCSRCRHSATSTVR